MHVLVASVCSRWACVEPVSQTNPRATGGTLSGLTWLCGSTHRYFKARAYDACLGGSHPYPSYAYVRLCQLAKTCKSQIDSRKGGYRSVIEEECEQTQHKGRPTREDEALRGLRLGEG